MKTQDTPAQREMLGAFSFSLAALLLVFLPSAATFRSPGGVSSSWFFCASAGVALLLWNIWGFKRLWRGKLINRLGLYFSTGIAVGVLLMLVLIWQEQRQFDHWAHYGIRYFDPIE